MRNPSLNFSAKTIPEFRNDLLHFISTEYDKTTRYKHIKLFKILNPFNSDRKTTQLNWFRDQGRTNYL